MLSEVTFTQTQFYGVVGVVFFLLTFGLLVRQVFNYAKKDDLDKLETALKEELKRQSLARHDMRHEITRIEVSLGKLEAKMENLPEMLWARINRPPPMT